MLRLRLNAAQYSTLVWQPCSWPGLKSRQKRSSSWSNCHMTESVCTLWSRLQNESRYWHDALDGCLSIPSSSLPHEKRVAWGRSACRVGGKVSVTTRSWKSPHQRCESWSVVSIPDGAKVISFYRECAVQPQGPWFGWGEFPTFPRPVSLPNLTLTLMSKSGNSPTMFSGHIRWLRLTSLNRAENTVSWFSLVLVATSIV
jgi:hypothetical protein